MKPPQAFGRQNHEFPEDDEEWQKEVSVFK